METIPILQFYFTLFFEAGFNPFFVTLALLGLFVLLFIVFYYWVTPKLGDAVVWLLETTIGYLGEIMRSKEPVLEGKEPPHDHS